ncbi:hypothetical protein NMY22_g12068 [Coprinellus aureogranulatus]|nr:hypothetical protein NMY22_g12068 [Coprinellus aureogranulatus]
MPTTRRHDPHPHPHPEPQPIPQDMTDDYYHYYMASQKRVSRWISQTQRELETATPMPVPSLFDVSMGQSAIKEGLGAAKEGKGVKETREGKGKEGEREGRKAKGGQEEEERGLRSNSTSTLVASSSSKTRAGDEESPESRRRRKEKEREKVESKLTPLQFRQCSALIWLSHTGNTVTLTAPGGSRNAVLAVFTLLTFILDTSAVK